MNKNRPDQHLPEEVIGFLHTIFFMPVVAIVALATTTFLPAVTSLKGTDGTRLFWIGLGAGIFGIVLLFFARLPLYRQHRFLTFGPQALDRLHRRLYWLAYLFVFAGIALLGIDWLCLK